MREREGATNILSEFTPLFSACTCLAHVLCIVCSPSLLRSRRCGARPSSTDLHHRVLFHHAPHLSVVYVSFCLSTNKQPTQTHRYGIYNDKMANCYVRNSRFEGSSHADIYLAASTGNSVRRSVSQGSAQFIVSPARAPNAVNPTVIQDNRVDGWTSTKSAIEYNLRGPVTMFDNQFSNGPTAAVAAISTAGTTGATAAAAAVQPRPSTDSNYTMWILANNTVNGNATGVIDVPSNVQVYDIDAIAPRAASNAGLVTTLPGCLQLSWLF